MRRLRDLNLISMAFWGLVALATASLTCHLLHLHWQGWALHFPDSQSYLIPAYTLADRGEMGDTHRTIGYPLFLAVTGGIKRMHSALIAQHLLIWLADIALAAALWRRWRNQRFGPLVALICGWLQFFHTETFFYSHGVLSEAPTVALIKLAIAALVGAGGKAWGSSAMLVLLALGTLFRSPLLFCLLAAVPAMALLGRWKQAALAAALGGLAWGTNLTLTPQLYPPGLSAAAAILPLLNLDRAPNPAFASAMAPLVQELQSTAPSEDWSESRTFNVIWSYFREDGERYFVRRLHPSPYRESGREWGRLAFHTYLTRPFELTRFHLRRISVGLIVDAMAFRALSAWPVKTAKGKSCEGWKTLKERPSYYRSYYRKTDFGCPGPHHDGARLPGLFRFLSLVSLPTGVTRWLYALMLVAGLYGTSLAVIRGPAGTRLILVVLLSAAGGYALAISGFNVPAARYAFPLQPFVVVLGGYGLVLAASRQAPAPFPVPSPYGETARP